MLFKSNATYAKAKVLFVDLAIVVPRISAPTATSSSVCSLMVEEQFHRLQISSLSPKSSTIRSDCCSASATIEIARPLDILPTNSPYSDSEQSYVMQRCRQIEEVFQAKETRGMLSSQR